MKNILNRIPLIIFILSFFATSHVFAQRVSVTSNFSVIENDRVEGENVNVLDENTTTASLNLRFYDQNLWAIRLGAGVKDLEYKFQDGTLNTSYDVNRESFFVNVGLEKHFRLPLNPYLGVNVPITFDGDDTVNNNSIDNSSVKTGFNVLAGANLSLFKILRIGFEFNTGFNSFNKEVLKNLSPGETSSIKLKNMDYRGEITVGVAL
ncbi:MAG: hypothetical protein R3E32_06655 [Chitinophagales bacterium]